jgi:DNA-binding protein YbaB
MAREFDEMFIEEAIERYRRIDEQAAAFERASATIEVRVQSPDGLVTVVVSGSGEIRDVDIDDRLLATSGADVSRSVRLAVASAADAVRWARDKLRTETFADYDPIGRA